MILNFNPDGDPFAQEILGKTIDHSERKSRHLRCEVMPPDHNIGFIGAINRHAGVKLINPDGSPQESFSFEYPGQKYAARELAGLKGSIAWVLGAGMLVRTDLFRRIGGFDEDFFMYGEDQDLCLRIRKARYEIGFIDSALMVHLRGQSERQSPRPDI